MNATYRQLDLGPVAAPPGGDLESSPLLEMAEIAKCSGHKVVFDCETTGLHWWRDRVIGVAFWCPDGGVRGYVPCADRSDVDAIQSIMLDWSSDTTVINHNIKFDFHFMGIDPLAAPWQYFDTLIMAHLFDSRGAPQPSGRWDNPINERGSLSLERLALVWLRDSAKADYKELVKRNDYGKHHHWPLRLTTPDSPTNCATISRRHWPDVDRSTCCKPPCATSGSSGASNDVASNSIETTSTG
jgi:DNA polymerase I-like protein with 3'-5' exonuclease and polymerase domains